MSPPGHYKFWREGCKCNYCTLSSIKRHENLDRAVVILFDVFGDNLECDTDDPSPRISFTVDEHKYILNGMDTPR